jgi:hypothetical protein
MLSGYSYFPGGAAMPLPSNDPPSTFSSPGVRHEVPIETFCTKYNISATDKAKLEILEYKPGNRIVESLADSDWLSAGFSVLGWRSFIAAHRRFCAAIKDGTWE